MPGEVLECQHCKMQIRWGYPSHAIAFALGKRPEANETEIIEDFFHFNTGISRAKPTQCPRCGAKAENLTVIHTYE